MTDTRRPSPRGLNTAAACRAAQALAIVALAGMAAGCSTHDPASTGSISADYRERHPIVLREAPRTLDVFAGRGRTLDRRQEADVMAFGRDYLANGKGGMVAYVPNAPDSQQQLAGVRGALSRAGLNGTHISIVPYAPEDPTAAAPVRLSFSKLQAQVDSRCDEWSEDLGGAPHLQSWQNRPVPNFGCSYQKNLAAQVANSIDLVRPREETAIDSEKRLDGVQRLRAGTDPSTIYNSAGPTISQAIPNP